MGFEVYTPRRTDGLMPGQGALDCNGTLRLTGEDLRYARINGECVVLVDTVSKRLALRAPKVEDDGLTEPTIRVRKSGQCGLVQVGGALILMGLRRGGARGRHTLIRKEDLLIVSIDVQAAAPKGKGRK